jgi:thioredoxin 1
MNTTKSLVTLFVVGLVVVAAFVLRSQGSADVATDAVSSTPRDAETEGVPTFVELGSDRCTSCRAMIPVLDELRAEHGCNLTVRFIDVWDHPDEGERFGVSTIPTQVLLAPDGQEITRHTGFWSAASIQAAYASGGHPLSSDMGKCGS